MMIYCLASKLTLNIYFSCIIVISINCILRVMCLRSVPVFFKVGNKVDMVYFPSLFEAVPCLIDASIHISVDDKAIQFVVFNDAGRNEVIAEAEKFCLQKQ